jgi:uncharacterized protein with HEPN domain
MHDKILIIESLEQLEQTIQNLLDATSSLQNIEELPKSPNGMLVLNGICMSFIVIGEEVKRIDRYSEKQLLPKYPSIPWKTVMGMRDRIVHGYFEVDIDVIFDTLKNDIPPLLKVIKQIKIDLQKAMIA